MDQRSASASGEYDDGNMVLGDTRLFAAAISRKRAEQDAMLLQNRINLLRAEEAKAQKKIEETKKRANEILDLRTRNDDRRMAKEEREFGKDKELDDLRDHLLKKRDGHRQNLHQVKTNLQNQRIEARNNIKEERKKILERCKVEREGEYSRAASKRDIIRTAAIALSNRRHKAMEDKTTEARRQFEDRVLLQEHTRKQKEDQIMRMEQEEVELIQALQQTQQRQRAAYDQLEDILQQPRESSRGSEQRTPLGNASSSSAAAKQKPKPGQGSPKAKGSSKSTYTTVDGTTIEVGPEDDLDLHAILGDDKK
jgi:hypothetical protein